MRIKETKVYTYAELSESAQAKARDWYRQTCDGDTFWSESVTDDFADVAKALGYSLDIRRGSRSTPAVYWSGFSSQGDGASFNADWRASACDVDALLADRPTDKELARIASELSALAVACPEGSGTAKASNRGHFMHCDFDSNIDSDSEDYANDSPDVLRAAEAGHADTFTEATRDLTHWLYSALEAEYDYANSDDSVAENIACNEYEFTADGRRV